MYIFLFLLAFCLVGLFFLYLFSNPSGWKDTQHVTVLFENKQTVQAEIAASSLKKRVGLSSRTELGPQEGMLFVFSKSFRYPFWMYGMRFAIDIVWIENNVVVDITRSLPVPEKGTFPKTVIPAHAVDMVLELSDGSADRFGIAVGQRVEIEARH